MHWDTKKICSDTFILYMLSQAQDVCGSAVVYYSNSIYVVYTITILYVHISIHYNKKQEGALLSTGQPLCKFRYRM